MITDPTCRFVLVVLALAAACGAPTPAEPDPDAAPGSDGGVDAVSIDAPTIDAALVDAAPADAAVIDAPLIDAPTDAVPVDAPPADAAMPDPSDPVMDVPAHPGAYTFGKLTTSDSTVGGSGTWFNDDVTEHRVTTTRVRYARYRDGMVLQSKTAAQFLLYDQQTTTVGAPIALPSDAVGRVTIRGGLVYVGGLGKVYSYELATQMWRFRALPGAGTCHHVAAGHTRLFVMCVNASAATTDSLYATWANTTMSDPAPLGDVTPGVGAASAWITAAPDGDVAFFASRTPDLGCVGRATPAGVQPCVFSLRNLGIPTAAVHAAQVAEDGATLYVAANSSIGQPNTLYEVRVSPPQAIGIRTIDSFATCPDNSVVFQDGVISQRRAGGVTTDVRLGSGGEADMGCPLKKL